MDLNETLISTDLLKYFVFSYIHNKCVITFVYFFVTNRQLHLIQLNREVMSFFMFLGKFDYLHEISKDRR